jgi:hypothetical protein
MKATFFGNILASAYKYYAKNKRIDAIYQAKLLIVIIQNLSCLLFLLLLNEYMGLPIFSFLYKYSIIVIIIYIILFFLVFRFYNKHRVETYIRNFEEKSLSERKMWAFLALAMSMLPITLFFLILFLRHPA